MENNFKKKAVNVLLLLIIVGFSIRIASSVFDLFDYSTFLKYLNIGDLSTYVLLFSIFLFAYDRNKTVSKVGVILCSIYILATILFIPLLFFSHIGESLLLSGGLFFIGLSSILLFPISICLYKAIVCIMNTNESEKAYNFLKLYIIFYIIGIALEIVYYLRLFELTTFISQAKDFIGVLKDLFVSLALIYCFLEPKKNDYIEPIAINNTENQSVPVQETNTSVEVPQNTPVQETNTSVEVPQNTPVQAINTGAEVSQNSPAQEVNINPNVPQNTSVQQDNIITDVPQNTSTQINNISTNDK